MAAVAVAAVATVAVAVDSAVPPNAFAPTAVVLASTSSAADVGAAHKLPPRVLVLPQFEMLDNLLRVHGSTL